VAVETTSSTPGDIYETYRGLHISRALFRLVLPQKQPCVGGMIKSARLRLRYKSERHAALLVHCGYFLLLLHRNCIYSLHSSDSESLVKSSLADIPTVSAKHKARISNKGNTSAGCHKMHGEESHPNTAEKSETPDDQSTLATG
jgi:hypothetical protein